VYITEAHAKDEWPVGSKISVCDQAKTLPERLTIARRFVDEFEYKIPMAVDTLHNTFQQTFAAWPFRFYVIHKGQIALKAQPDEQTYAYRLADLSQWLQSNA